LAARRGLFLLKGEAAPPPFFGVVARRGDLLGVGVAAALPALETRRRGDAAAEDVLLVVLVVVVVLLLLAAALGRCVRGTGMGGSRLVLLRETTGWMVHIRSPTKFPSHIRLLRRPVRSRQKAIGKE